MHLYNNTVNEAIGPPCYIDIIVGAVVTLIISMIYMSPLIYRAMEAVNKNRKSNNINI